jgi:hypothetical protein
LRKTLEHVNCFKYNLALEPSFVHIS